MNYSITTRKIIWNDAYNNKQDTKHNNVNTNDDVDTLHFDDRVAHHNMHWACTHCFTVLDHHTHIPWLKSSLAPFTPSPCHPCVRWLSLFDSTFSALYFFTFLLSVFLSLFFLSYHEALHEGHGKPAPLRGERDWGHLRRLHSHHRLWAQGPWLRRAPELINPPLLQDPFHGPGRGWPDTRARCSLRHTEDKSITSHKEACQSASRRRLEGSMDQGNLMEKEWSIDQGNLLSVTARKHRLRLYLKSKGKSFKSFLRSVTQGSVITNSKQLKQKSTDSFKDSYGNRIWNFVKPINEVLQRWKNYGNFRVLPSIRSQDESSSRTRNTILELAGWVQELQNEVNCMNDSKDFQDAESVRSGNSHVTSRPVSFPPHPIPEGMLRHSFVTPSRREGPPSIWDTHGISGNVFADPPASSSAPYPQGIESMEYVNWGAAPFVHSGEKWKARTKTRSEMPVWTVSQRFSHLQWRRLFKELWERPTTTADFGSSLWQVPYTSYVCLLEDKIQDWGMYLFTISYGSYALDQISGDGWFSGWFKIFGRQ